MKIKLYTILLIVLPIYTSAQSDLGILSIYIQKYDPVIESTGFLKNFDEFVRKERIDEGLGDEIAQGLQTTLGQLFTLEDPAIYLQKSEYKSLLEAYEWAPEVVEYGLEGNNLSAKSDYRLSEHQVYFVGDYLAIGDYKPYNNKEAIVAGFKSVNGVKGLAVIFVSFDQNFSGSSHGVGNAKIRATATVRIYNASGKRIFGKNASGASTTEIEIGTDTAYNKDVITEVFREAFNSAMSRANTKFPKLIAKIKW